MRGERAPGRVVSGCHAATLAYGNHDAEQNQGSRRSSAIAISDGAASATFVAGWDRIAAGSSFAASAAVAGHSAVPASAGHSTGAARAHGLILAIVRAAVARHAIGIVALFHAAPYVAIAAACFEASAETVIEVRGIAVVTCFARLNDAVAARGARAQIRARIVVVLIAVVARFDAKLDVSVAARRVLAILNAAIGIRRIGVVAFFDAVLYETVTAFGFLARRRTIIDVRRIAIVALFLACAHEAVAARSVLARHEAIIGIDWVSVVAFFGRLHDAVTATGQAAVVLAGIGVVLIAIVARFDAALHIAVTA